MRKNQRYELLLEAVRRVVARGERSLATATAHAPADALGRCAFLAGWYEQEVQNMTDDLRAAVGALEGEAARATFRAADPHVCDGCIVCEPPERPKDDQDKER